MKYKKIYLTAVLLTSTLMTSAQTDQIAESCNAFACDLYSQLNKQDGNLFFSPYSVSTTLSMAYAGAQGITEQEMAYVLHNTLPQEQFHHDYATLIKKLNNKEINSPYELEIANKLFIQNDFNILPSFQQIMQINYTNAFDFVDFVFNPQAASDTINNWVSLKTKNKIKGIVSPKDFDPLTRMVITNAIYFKGTWVKQFEKNATKKCAFHLNKENNTDVEMMQQKESFKYMENENLQMIELPYKGDNLSMFVILPKKIDGIKNIDSTLTEENLKNLMYQLQMKEVIVKLPKFEMETKYSLNHTLSQMGMPTVFTSKANFLGISQIELYIKKVVHKAYIKTDEEGSEAAAATAIIMNIKSLNPIKKPKYFIADHPFIFLIKDKETNLILFMGRFAKPA